MTAAVAPLAGIVSCFAFNPLQPAQLAAGSYSGKVAIYDVGTMSMELLLSGHVGGVTHARFSACGNYLFTGARQVGCQ